MQTLFLHIAILFSFYILGAYATTDILRLLNGAQVSINEPDCYCPICNHKILLKDQLPILSYLKNHGKCFYCQSSIPFSDLFLEIFLFIAMSSIAFFFHFNWISYFLCLTLYEITKFFFILIHGTRKDYFIKNLIISFFNNLIIFLLIAILFFISQLL